MNPSAGVLSSLLAAAGFGDLLSLLIRVTLIAATGMLLCSRLRHASAAKRHLIAMTTLIALVAFPVAKGLLPVLPLPILPPSPSSTSFQPEGSPAVRMAGSSVMVAKSQDGATAGVVETGNPSSVMARPISEYVILLSLMVSLALLLHVLVSLIAAGVAARRALRIDAPEMRRDLESACARLGVPRTVDVRESSDVTVPVVWGFFRPVLLLPVGAREWSREQLRVVFLHEVAHVARHDAVGLLLTRIATSLFWFHPLVWNLARIARRECERCCDDLVLAAGERPTDYAAHLLAIVRSMTRQDRFSGVAPALAQRSNLEGRLVSILRNGQRRDSVSRSRLVATIGFATFLLVATTVVRVVAAPEPARLASADAPNSLEAACDTEADADSDAGQTELVMLEPNLENDRAASIYRSIPNRTQLPDVFEAPGEAVPVEEVSVAPPPVYFTGGSSVRYKKGVKSEKGDLNQSGIEFMRDGQYARAIAAFEQEIRESGSTNAMYNLACARALQGNKRSAFEALQNAIENGFDNTQHMSEDEDLRLLQGDPHFYQLVRLAQDLQLFGSGRLGFGMKDEEDWRRSLSRFERVTKEHPDVGRAWANLGFARLEAGDPKGGTAAYQRALDLKFQTPTTLYNLACCAARSGDINGAFQWLDRSDKAGFEIGEHVGSDTDLDALRGDPRYGAMLERWDQKMAKEHQEKQRAEERQKTD